MPRRKRPSEAIEILRRHHYEGKPKGPAELQDAKVEDQLARTMMEMLLPAVRGKHRPLTARHFEQLRVRARRKAAPE